MAANQPVARTMWRLYEPIHAITYFAPETRAATDALGLRGGWMSYFGCRAAPLGPASAALVTALFYNFHPAMVARAVPDVWGYASPDRLLTARLQAADEAMRRIFGAVIGSDSVAEAATLARTAAETTDNAGRWEPPMPPYPGPISRTWSSGRRPRCCGSTVVTATWRRC